MQRIDELLNAAKSQLINSDTAQLDAEILLALVLDKQRSYLRAYPEEKLDQDALQKYSQLIARRAAGEPVAHLTGTREFWSMNLHVTPDTLVPRPDTELLVETALQYLGEIKSMPIRLADLGTGSGAIALAIASDCQQCDIIATDLSTAALAVAKHNAAQLQLDNIEFIHSNWCSAFADNECFDMLVSNPPYIAQDDPHMHTAELKCEPEFALTSGKDGLDALRSITKQAPHFLKKGGWLLVEHGYDQAEAVRNLFHKNGFINVETKQDLGQNDRVCLGQWP